MKNKVIVLMLNLLTCLSLGTGLKAAQIKDPTRTVERPELGKFIELPQWLTNEIAEYLPDAELTVLGKTSVAFYCIARDILKKRSANLIKYWTTPNIMSMLLKGHAAEVSSAAFSPNNQLLATGSADRTIIIRDVKTGKRIAVLVGHTGIVNSVAFSPDGTLLASGSADRTVLLWNIRTIKSIQPVGWLKGHSFAVKLVAFSPDGAQLVSSDAIANTILWNVETRTKNNEYNNNRCLERLAAAFSPEGNTLITGSENRIMKWTKPTITGWLNRIWSSLISYPDEVLSIIDVKNMSPGLTFYSYVFSPDIKVLALGGSDGNVRLINTASGSVKTLHGHGSPPVAMAFSQYGKLLAVGYGDYKVSLCGVANDVEILSLPVDEEVYSVAFSSDSKILAAGLRDGTTAIFFKA